MIAIMVIVWCIVWIVSGMIGSSLIKIFHIGGEWTDDDIKFAVSLSFGGLITLIISLVYTYFSLFNKESK